MIVCGVAHKLHIDEDGVDANKTVGLSFAYCWRDGESGKGFLRRPRTWRIQLPSGRDFSIAKFGSSETRGVLGGVENDRKRIVSESVERAIGDAITIGVIEVIDEFSRNWKESWIVINGPALPKVVGRLASLRPPSNVGIGWMCQQPVSNWFGYAVGAELLLPTYAKSISGTRWEHEDLVDGYETSQFDRNVVVQYLQMPSSPCTFDVHAFELMNNAHNSLPIQGLPCEVALATAQTEHQVANPYSAEPREEMCLQQCQVCEGMLAKVPRQSEREHLLGWDIVWKNRS